MSQRAGASCNPTGRIFMVVVSFIIPENKRDFFYFRSASLSARFFPNRPDHTTNRSRSDKRSIIRPAQSISPSDIRSAYRDHGPVENPDGKTNLHHAPNFSRSGGTNVTINRLRCIICSQYLEKNRNSFVSFPRSTSRTRTFSYLYPHL